MKKSALPLPGFFGILLILAGISATGQPVSPVPAGRIRTIPPYSKRFSFPGDSVRQVPPFRLVSTPIGPVYGIMPALSGGWFCRQEWRLEKSTGIPFRFRLGSLEQVNWLERKPNALPPHLLR